MKMADFYELVRSYGTALLLYLVTPVLSAPASPYDKCGQLFQMDCTINYIPEPNETVCCSDGNTYDNLCFFAKAKCQDLQLEVQHTGRCETTTVAPGVGTTMTADTPTGPTEDPTLDVIHSVFCTNYDQVYCTDELDPVCGSDNVFYPNNCEFAKAMCKDPNLTEQELHVCKSARHVRRSTEFA